MATPPFLVRLMDHRPLSSGFKLGPEDTEAYRFAMDLRAATLAGTLKAVWLHPANELGGQTTLRKGKRVATPLAALARALGLITGASDYLFLHATGSLAIEFKSATGSLSPGQRDFRDWCEAQGVPFYTARSAALGCAILREKGLLT